MGIKRTDYTIKEEYNLSLITDECKEILTQKNNGKTFVSIAHDLGCSTSRIRGKSKSAIDILQSKKLSKKYAKIVGKVFTQIAIEQNIARIAKMEKYM